MFNFGSLWARRNESVDCACLGMTGAGETLVVVVVEVVVVAD